ncbi:MAG: exodeoxyribonuclease VII large subunit [Sphaerochaetaceae bacterium]|nr:exodeoxyribonuclease VII large subunit [Sphaerochaetaceae bacterium]
MATETGSHAAACFFWLMEQILPKMTVTKLTSLIKETLEGSFYGLCVEGEVSGFKPSSNGHWYFSLKDGDAVIGAAVWRTNVARIGIVPKDGMKVIVNGDLSVWPPSGTYRLICTSMRVSGEGDILARLEERKRYWESLGYFSPSIKKPIPENPRKIAVVTSPTGAALQDILQITRRRNSGMDIVIFPATVQGSGAAETIADRIRDVNRYAAADVIIVGRGGGSIEDLLPFSEDCVIQAIHDSEIPIISAVGHEIDWAISDFAADLRAPTPSAAAELVCRNSQEQREKLRTLKFSMQQSITGKLNNARLKHESLTSPMMYKINEMIAKYRMRLNSAVNTVKALSPASVLERGFSIVTDSEGKTITGSDMLSTGSHIKIRFAKGHVQASVTEIDK